MFAELLRLLLVIGLLVVLPGWLLVNALFPPVRRSEGASGGADRAEVRGLERGYLVVGAGILLLILVGVLLGFLPHAGTGFFQTAGVGMPHVELAMTAVCLFLGWVGLRRGAYPALEKRFPNLVAPGAKQAAVREPQMR